MAYENKGLLASSTVMLLSAGLYYFFVTKKQKTKFVSVEETQLKQDLFVLGRIELDEDG